MTREVDLTLADGRTLHVYDDGATADEAAATVIWQHGTPQTGGLPEPLRSPTLERRIRWVSYDRPGYAGSTRHPGRRVADAAADVLVIADALDIERFVAVGHSGGGPPSLAFADIHPERASAVVSISGLAPFGTTADWFAGMGTAGEAELRASVAGEESLRELLAHSDFDPELFTPADYETLAGEWRWLDGVVAKGLQHGVDGMVDDDLSYVADWGFDPAAIIVPVLLVHGTDDRIVPATHSQWFAGRCPAARLRLLPGEGHLSVLQHTESVLDWITQTVC